MSDRAALEPASARCGLILLAVLVLALLSLAPLFRLAVAALTPQGRLDPGPALSVIISPPALEALVHSLVTGFASALIATAIGIATAVIVGMVDIKGRRAFAFLFVLSMLMAPQVVALAFVSLSGPSSPLLLTLGLAPRPGTPNPLRGAAGISLILALHHAPLAFLVLRAGLRQLPREYLDAAALDGAGKLATLRRIVTPLLRRHIAAAALLAFAAAVGNFGIPALLGLPVDYLTLPTLIYQRLSGLGPAVISEAAALGALTALLAGLGVVAARMAAGRQDPRLEAGEGVEAIWRAGRWRWPLAAMLAVLVGVTLVLPLLSLAAEAFVPTYGVKLSLATLTLDNFVEVLERQAVSSRAFRNSFLFAASAGLGCTLLSLPVAYALVRFAPRLRPLAETLFDLPNALPGIVIAVAAILLFLRPLPVLGISLYATPFIIILAYHSRFFLLPLKSIMAALAQIEPSAEEAAALCGAGLAERLRHVVFPLVAPAAAAGGIIVFLFAFNELTVSALLWSAGTETLGVILFSLEEAGFASQAAAVALCATAVLVLLCLILRCAASRLPRGILPWD
jgi:iron(III) transport system permease protein